jgi:hypothetical protein
MAARESGAALKEAAAEDAGQAPAVPPQVEMVRRMFHGTVVKQTNLPARKDGVPEVSAFNGSDE